MLSLWQEYSHASSTNIVPLTEDVINSIPADIRGRVSYINDKVKELHANRVDWREVSRGVVIEVGNIGGRPIVLTFFFAYINGQKVAFYECCSQLADYKMIEDFLIEFQRTHDGYTRWNHTNAMNFHNCISGLSTIDVEPRNTTYNPN